MDTELRIDLDAQAFVVGYHLQRPEPRAVVTNHLGQDLLQAVVDRRDENRAPVIARQKTWKAHRNTTLFAWNLQTAQGDGSLRVSVGFLVLAVLHKGVHVLLRRLYRAGRGQFNAASATPPPKTS